LTKEDIHCYFTGTAGAGKSTLTQAFDRYFDMRGLDAVTVNLDPGAERLPYEPDVDIRDWIRLDDVMKEHGLGPNGAQVAAADLIAVQLNDLRAAISQYRSDYVLIDTPGQIELFVFREAGRYVVQNLNPGRSIVVYLTDPYLARTPNGFVSQLLLGATTEFRLQVPVAHVLSKADVLSFDDLEKIQQWAEDHDALFDALQAEDPSIELKLSGDIIKVLSDLGAVPGLIQTSAASGEGVEDIYQAVQDTFLASEDLEAD
jgi:GPN-loop GTPase